MSETNQILRDQLSVGLQQLPLSESQRSSATIAAFLNYLELLIKWNKAYNLTAIRDPKEMVIRHIFDSLSLQPYLHGRRIIDVGTGAGLPGIPLAIVNPEREFCLLDSNGKKIRFLIQAVQALGLTNVKVINNRAEAFTAEQCFDSVVSRAFAAINTMLQQTQHLCCRDGMFLAMKGTYPQEELVVLPEDFKVTGVHRVTVPFLDEQRHIVCLGYREPV